MKITRSLTGVMGMVGLIALAGVAIWRQQSRAIALPATYQFTDLDATRTVNGKKPVQSERSADRILVKFKSTTKAADQSAVIAEAGLTEKKKLGTLGISVYMVSTGASAEDVVAALKKRPEVEFAEQDGIVPQAEVKLNDPWFSYLAPYAAKLQLPQAWDLTTGSKDTVIAVIDSGIRTTHEDLSGQFVTGENTLDGSPDTTPVDSNSHGTLVAGVIAAKGNNEIGGAGICWQCRIMPVRAAHVAGKAYLSEIADGIRYAADHGSRIAVASFRLDMSSATLTAAVNYMDGKKGIVITAAGNDGSALPIADQPNLIVVTGTDGSDNKVVDANRGPFVDLAAPYYSYSTAADSDTAYRGFAGTSVSAPYVAGIAGLVLSANPNLSAAQLRDVLFSTADDLGDLGRDDLYGWGRVNAFKAVQKARGL